MQVPINIEVCEIAAVYYSANMQICEKLKHWYFWFGALSGSYSDEISWSKQKMVEIW